MSISQKACCTNLSPLARVHAWLSNRWKLAGRKWQEACLLPKDCLNTGCHFSWTQLSGGTPAAQRLSDDFRMPAL